MLQHCVFIIGHVIVRIAKKRSKTILHRVTYRKLINIQKAIKLTENTIVGRQ